MSLEEEYNRVKRKLAEIIGDDYPDRSMWPLLARVEKHIAAATKRAEDAERHIETRDLWIADQGLWNKFVNEVQGVSVTASDIRTKLAAAEHRAVEAEKRVRELEGACKTLRDERADWMRCSANDGEVRKATARAVEAEKRADAMHDECAHAIAEAELRAHVAEAERDALRAALERARQNSADWAVEKGEETKRADTLAAQVAGLLDALRVFAEEADRYDPDDGDSHHTAWATSFNIRDLRQARQTLAASPSTRTAALIRAGEAAVEETRLEAASSEAGSKDDWRKAQRAWYEARGARRKACAAVPDIEKENG